MGGCCSKDTAETPAAAPSAAAGTASDGYEFFAPRLDQGLNMSGGGDANKSTFGSGSVSATTNPMKSTRVITFHDANEAPSSPAGGAGFGGANPMAANPMARARPGPGGRAAPPPPPGSKNAAAKPPAGAGTGMSIRKLSGDDGTLKSPKDKEGSSKEGSKEGAAASPSTPSTGVSSRKAAGVVKIKIETSDDEDSP